MVVTAEELVSYAVGAGLALGLMGLWANLICYWLRRR